MENKYEALKKLLENEETFNELIELSPEEASAVLKSKYGLEFSLDELKEVAMGMKKGMEEEDTGDALSDDALEQVSGGGKSLPYDIGYYIGKGVKAGAAIYGAVKVVAAIAAFW